MCLDPLCYPNTRSQDKQLVVQILQSGHYTEEEGALRWRN